MKTQTIYLVIEEGNGFLHKAFIVEIDADIYAEQLSKETGLNCFEVQSLELNIPEAEDLYF